MLAVFVVKICIHHANTHIPFGLLGKMMIEGMIRPEGRLKQ